MDLVRLTLRIPSSLRDEVETEASSLGVSLAEVVRRRLAGEDPEPRGVLRGTGSVRPYRPPTDIERGILTWAESRGVSAIQMEAHLPGLDLQGIRNHLNMIRKKRLGRCSKCSRVLEPGMLSCESCREQAREAREAYVAAGRCVRCREPIDDGGSVTTCSSCLVGVREANRKTLLKKASRSQKAPTVSRKDRLLAKRAQQTLMERVGSGVRLFPWTYSCSGRPLVGVLPEGTSVVDLFSGGGDISRTASKLGHRVVAALDIHPLTTSFLRVIQSGDHLAAYDLASEWATRDVGVIKQRYGVVLEDHHPDHDVIRAALLYVMAHGVSGRDMRAKDLEVPVVLPTRTSFTSKVSLYRRHLLGIAIEALDFAEGIERYDAPDRVFVCDPPWPGSTTFEYDIEGRHGELIERLLGAQGEFLITLGSSRAAFDLLQKVPHIYWRTAFSRGQHVRELVASSWALPEEAGCKRVPAKYRG